jgi:hypothetical protein
MSERDIQNDILRELSRGDTRLLRINCGQSYQGRVIEQTPTRLILSPWYPIKLAATGVSDLLGWTSPDHGERVAIFCAIEVKGPRTRTTVEQLAFRDLVLRSGGRAGIARSVDEARAIIEG